MPSCSTVSPGCMCHGSYALILLLAFLRRWGGPRAEQCVHLCSSSAVPGDGVGREGVLAQLLHHQLRQPRHDLRGHGPCGQVRAQPTLTSVTHTTALLRCTRPVYDRLLASLCQQKLLIFEILQGQCTHLVFWPAGSAASGSSMSPASLCLGCRLARAPLLR